MAVTVADAGPGAAPPVVAPPPGNPRFPLLDSVRAIAALSILTTHATFLSGFNFKSGGQYPARLDAGVTLFFVLSGFLLYRPFVSARLDGRTQPRLRDYARRRVLRIVPAYWLALTLLAIWPGLPGVFDQPWRYYLLLQWLHPWSVIQGLAVSWSLSVEVFFYIALPFYALGMARLLRGRTRGRQVGVELIVLSALAVASVASRQIVHHDDVGSTYQLTLPAFLYWFGLGMSAAVISAWLADRTPAAQPPVVRLIARRPWLPWLGAAIVWWFVANHGGLSRGLDVHYTGLEWFGEHALYGLMGILFLLPAVFGVEGRGWPRRLLATRALSWLGLISYGIFLWHLPLAGKLAEHNVMGRLSPIPGTISLIGLTFIAAGICATASYYLVERPILRFKETPLLRRRKAPAAPSPGPAPSEG